jgi:hypothetical protein
MPSETGVPGLKLAAFLQPKDDKDTWNNPIRHCAIRDPYVYALSRGGTLWTFLLPPNTNRAEASVIYPISAVQTEGNGNDMIVLGRTLLLTGSEACLEVLSLDKPEHPEPIAARGPQLSGHSGQLLLAGDHLFYFGGWYNAKTNQAGFIALFDVADPRQPRLIGMTNYPHGLVSGCIVSNRLVLQQHVGDWQRPPLRYSLAAFSLDAAWPLRLAGETPCDEWLPWLVPTGEEEILAVGDNSTRMLNWSNDGGPQFLPNPIPGGGRSAILSEHAGGRFLILQSSVLRRRDFGWEFHGEIPTMSQMDGSPYRAAAQGSFVAVPAGERVWLYSWSDASGTSILNK